MYLKKLELLGFKSFMEKTALNFEPGITAVVGPNGTGKSNIVDSIRWVLGEQSVKALRGSQMEDVIFNGTDSREALGMAEVTLTFDNTQRFFSVDHDEVAITRRIFRSGESEYLLNKTQVRLKDIMDLLMGTGIGAESYSLIQQGKIDLILSSRPEDRRLVFDEASGITKYKTQKKETLRKLEETDQNLLRVNDIIIEVKRQISSLERQANKARRYKEVFEEVKSKELVLAALQKKSLNKERRDIAQKINELGNKENTLLNAIKSQELKINNRQNELEVLEQETMAIKNELLNLDNSISRNNERIDFNQERIKELEANKGYLKEQIKQAEIRLASDEQKLKGLKDAYSGINKNIEEKRLSLQSKESELNNLGSAIKSSSDAIGRAKAHILDTAAKLVNIKNQISDLTSKQQIHLARKKRLEIEKAKVCEEKALAEDNLKGLESELRAMEKDFADLNSKMSGLKNELAGEQNSLNQITLNIEGLEKEKLTLQSNREFLEKLKAKYEDIGEAMNAVLYLDKLPTENVTGLVIKVKENCDLTAQEKQDFGFANVKLSGEAKPIDLDTRRITDKINAIEEKQETLKNSQAAKQSQIEEIGRVIESLQANLRNQEMSLVNKRASYQGVLDTANKIKEEEDIIVIELSDLQQEISILENQIVQLQVDLSAAGDAQKQAEELITKQQESIALNSVLKEKALVIIAQTKTELDGLNRRLDSDNLTIETLEDTYKHNKEALENLRAQENEAQQKQEALKNEITGLENKINATRKEIENQKDSLKGSEEKYCDFSRSIADVVKKIELDRGELGTVKNGLYQLQMQDKDAEFKCTSLRERMLNNYKVELDGIEEPPQAADENLLSQEIKNLKEKLDSYGAVNLVAIEEYDELKKRYDFLTQQQNDLLSAKESLHEAIAKINRTTKKMFLETFEKVCVEFRNYFRLLFGGGDAQVFLVDEQDPLDSGIEIICRPPGKKLQNVLLLSGGEKSLAAIALLFAIFKVKPSPFCVLDEIDAALDEANVDRFGTVVQEFAKLSQFIFITHNKRTIANADVMYGITMEESGVSKIISVKFTENKPLAKEPEVAVAA